ncbi:hypothetical protein E3E12_08230 [Formicincola oecophyllae]|uniref:Uncharacterized protein n=1 Tax=Formicincola oecophyllae TaxID=2558361 RepID=A0A4Y6UB56_9PROT|nr:hypothetical protein [Formicincola oecophyllae]QDH14180.1 hypothetical protein E3E12_08230 [Formicincola oecophyllae]
MTTPHRILAWLAAGAATLALAPAVRAQVISAQEASPAYGQDDDGDSAMDAPFIAGVTHPRGRLYDVVVGVDTVLLGNKGAGVQGRGKAQRGQGQAHTQGPKRQFLPMWRVSSLMDRSALIGEPDLVPTLVFRQYRDDEAPQTISINIARGGPDLPSCHHQADFTPILVTIKGDPTDYLDPTLIHQGACIPAHGRAHVPFTVPGPHGGHYMLAIGLATADGLAPSRRGGSTAVYSPRDLAAEKRERDSGSGADLRLARVPYGFVFSRPVIAALTAPAAKAFAPLTDTPLRTRSRPEGVQIDALRFSPWVERAGKHYVGWNYATPLMGAFEWNPPVATSATVSSVLWNGVRVTAEEVGYCQAPDVPAWRFTAVDAQGEGGAEVATEGDQDLMPDDNTMERYQNHSSVSATICASYGGPPVELAFPTASGQGENILFFLPRRHPTLVPARHAPQRRR